MTFDFFDYQHDPKYKQIRIFDPPLLQMKFACLALTQNKPTGFHRLQADRPSAEVSKIQTHHFPFSGNNNTRNTTDPPTRLNVGKLGVAQHVCENRNRKVLN